MGLNMRQILTTTLAAAALGTVSLLSGGVTPASAGSITMERLDASGVKAEYTQYRRGFRGRGFHGPRYGYRGGYYRRGYGAAPLIGGLAAGALIGGAIASQAAPAPGYYAAQPDDDAVAYCAQRFKSYDPASGTYLGYDGQRHPCP